MSQINQYANSVTAINDNDYLDVDKYISLGVYQSNKILGSDLKAQFGSNFATSNLTFTDNRTHDLDSKTLLLGKGKDYTFEAAVVAPSIGKASFNFKGFGNTSSDEVIRVRNGNNEDLLKINGDGSFFFNNHVPSSFGAYFDILESGVSKFSLDEYGVRCRKPFYVSTIRAYTTTAIDILPQSGGGALGFNLQPYDGYLSMGSTLGAEPSADIDKVHWFTQEISGSRVNAFKNSNGNIVKLYKQDLATSPTTGQIATLLSNLGLANLI